MGDENIKAGSSSGPVLTGAIGSPYYIDMGGTTIREGDNVTVRIGGGTFDRPAALGALTSRLERLEQLLGVASGLQPEVVELLRDCNKTLAEYRDQVTFLKGLAAGLDMRCRQLEGRLEVALADLRVARFEAEAIKHD